MKQRRRIRLLILAIGLLLILSSAPQLLLRAFAGAKSPTVTLDTSMAQPRQVEDATQAAIERDYANAWTVMKAALQDNRNDQLESVFTGYALDKMQARIAGQRSTNLHVRISDTGHKLQAVFYSPEGSAMELHDAVTMKLEVLDGSSVIHSEETTLNYVALMTVAEDHWKVRVLQEE